MTDNLPVRAADNLPAISATEIDQPGKYPGDARLYRLSAPVPYGWDGEATTSYVIVSAVAHFAVETYIFPANADGKIIDWCELPGSFRGDTDHERAIELAGWVLT